MSTVIKLENVSKQYRLGSIGTNTLKGDLQRWWYNMRGLPDPTLRIGEENKLSSSRLTPDTSLLEFVWALKDINFDVRQGEILGIIGKNGAGKSTLLKLLSRVTAPTTGTIKVKGRIASLLEVGTGFHPDLTGCENIFLNGAILGMTKAEIGRKFEEIVDFAGIAKYIDTPVKRYSSGMYVRLAFAVAAHLEPEILIVDEVLAVGDAEFQRKAIGKMQDVSRNAGRTVLFVSHNMQSIKSLCKTALILKQGNILDYGKAQTIVETYLQESSKFQSDFLIPLNKSNKFANVISVSILNKDGNPCSKIPLLEHFTITVLILVKEKLPHFIVGLGIATFDDIPLHTTHSKPMDIEPAKYEFTFTEDTKQYTTGKYKVFIGLSSRENNIQYLDDQVAIEIDDVFSKDILFSNKVGLILNQMRVEIKKIGQNGFSI